MTAFAPILIILCILGITVGALRRNKKKKRTYLSNNKIMGLLGVYIAILLLSAVLCVFIPSEKSSFFVEPSEKKVSHAHGNIYTKAINGKTEEIDPSYIVNHWEKNYHLKQLNLVPKNGEFLDTSIIIERTPANDHKIEGTYYQTKSMSSGVNVTDRIPIPLLEWSKNTLILSQIKKKIKLAMFKPALPISQFKKETSINEDHGQTFGTQLLYLRVPKDIKIKSSKKLAVEYVEQVKN